MFHRLYAIFLTIFTSTILLVILVHTQNSVLATDWQSKVSPAVLAELNGRSGAEVEFLVQLTAQADLSAAADLPGKEAKTRFVYEQLTAIAATSQRPLHILLDAQNIPYRSYWINNTIWTTGTAALVQTLASRPDVAYLHANPAVRFNEPAFASEQQATAFDALAVEWGIERIGAPLVWTAGVTGTGVIIAGQDTGYEWDHPALLEQYRGWDNTMMTVTHAYNWHDAIQEDISGNGFNPCGYQLSEPCDDNSHGTHTMGTMVGDDGKGNQVGVAPGARWISCRNMEQGYGTPETYINCFQWFLAPTDLNGENPRPELAPHIINNSWGCPPSEGCNSDNFAVMETVVDNLRTAGIAVVTSAGNSGSSCSSIDDPAAIFDSAITVGNTTFSDQLSFSSSRGPVLVDGSGRPKPDLSAPGTSIRSTTLGGSYSLKSGTSMAAPHVAGALALLIATHPQLAGDVDLLEQLLLQTSYPVTDTEQVCGGTSGTQLPNNMVGHGRLDVYKAFNSHIVQLATTTPLTVTAGEPFTIALTLQHDHPFSATPPLVISGGLPVSVTVLSATVPLTQDGQSWQLTAAPMPPGSELTITLTFSLTAAAPVESLTLPVNISGDNLVTLIAPAAEISVVGGQPFRWHYLPFIHHP